jgi:aconitate hydratase 2/2-methylisocitrate dehydratase
VRTQLGLSPSELFIRPAAPADTGKGFTLAQKMVGKACGLAGVRPGTSCEPLMTTVGSQDTTGPMTRDEMKELACLGFSADLVMQSFCHTAAYPKPVDLKTHAELPDFISSRGGVALRPGDGIIHSWLNHLLLPDTVGTGGDSHTRFPLGISFPAGSGLVAFAAAIGAMPLDMPESVLVKFSGSLQPGVTLRDVVNAIPYVAIQQGLLTVAKAGKKNIFSGRIMEIEGLPDLKLEQAFELTDATAERSCAGSTIKLSVETVSEYLRSNVALMKNMISRGYSDPRTLARRIGTHVLSHPRLTATVGDQRHAQHQVLVDRPAAVADVAGQVTGDHRALGEAHQDVTGQRAAVVHVGHRPHGGGGALFAGFVVGHLLVRRERIVELGGVGDGVDLDPVTTEFLLNRASDVEQQRNRELHRIERVVGG